MFQFSPDITSSVPHHRHYALEISEKCSPVIDHCRIKSTSVGKYKICRKCKTKFSGVLGEGIDLKKKRKKESLILCNVHKETHTRNMHVDSVGV